MKTAPWTTSEITFLRNNAPKFSVKELAVVLDRSSHSVYYQIYKYGIKSKKRTNKVWKSPGLKKVVHMREIEGMTFSKIAKELDSCETVIRRIYARHKTQA